MTDNDAAMYLALLQAERMTTTILAQLDAKASWSPLKVMLEMARGQAASAMVELTKVDPDAPKQIRHLQNEVARFTNLLEWLGAIVKTGFDAAQVIEDETRPGFLGMLDLDPGLRQQLEQDFDVPQQGMKDA